MCEIEMISIVPTLLMETNLKRDDPGNAGQKYSGQSIHEVMFAQKHQGEAHRRDIGGSSERAGATPATEHKGNENSFSNVERWHGGDVVRADGLIPALICAWL